MYSDKRPNAASTEGRMRIEPVATRTRPWRLVKRGWAPRGVPAKGSTNRVGLPKATATPMMRRLPAHGSGCPRSTIKWEESSSQASTASCSDAAVVRVGRPAGGSSAIMASKPSLAKHSWRAIGSSPKLSCQCPTTVTCASKSS